MAKDTAAKRHRLTELFILVFVIVMVVLLGIQFSGDVMALIAS